MEINPNNHDSITSSSSNENKVDCDTSSSTSHHSSDSSSCTSSSSSHKSKSSCTSSSHSSKCDSSSCLSICTSNCESCTDCNSSSSSSSCPSSSSSSSCPPSSSSSSSSSCPSSSSSSSSCPSSSSCSSKSSHCCPSSCTSSSSSCSSHSSHSSVCVNVCDNVVQDKLPEPKKRERCSETGEYAHEFGFDNQANGFASFAEGCSNIACGDCSHVEGYNNITYGNASHAEGFENETKNLASHAEGIHTKAYGKASHAEGSANATYGENSHVEGFNNLSNGSSSHVEGSYNVNNGNNAHVGGYKNTNNGNNGLVSGSNLVVNGDNVLATGSLGKSLAVDGSVQVFGGNDDVFNVVDRNELPANGDGLSTIVSTANKGVYPVGQVSTYRYTAEGSSLATAFENLDLPADSPYGYFVTFKNECFEGEARFDRLTYGNKNSVIGVTTPNYGVLLNAGALPVSHGVIKNEYGFPVISDNGETETNEDLRLSTNSVSKPYVSRIANGWLPVASVGVVAVRDDGTCVVGRMCSCNDAGIATRGNRYFVLRRLNANLIVIFLPAPVY